MAKQSQKQKPGAARGVFSAALAAEPSAESMRDTAYEDIKHRILTCEFKPGTCINEAAVSTLIGVGRTPVHQALDRLRIEGMIEVIPRKGAVVRPLVLHEVLQMVEVRLVNESYCAQLAAERAGAADIKSLQQIVGQAQQAIAARDVKLMMTLDRDFHSSLAKAAGNNELTDVLKRLNERSLRFWFISFTAEHHSEFQNQHEAILEAVQARDSAAAAAEMRKHIEAFRRSVSRYHSFLDQPSESVHAS